MNHQRVIKINEVGAFIWEVMTEDVSKSYIISRCLDEFDCRGQQVSDMEKIIDDYLGQLASYGLLCLNEQGPEYDIGELEVRHYNIAGIKINVYSEFAIQEFEPFLYDEAFMYKEEQNIFLIDGRETNSLPFENSKMIFFSAEDIIVYKTKIGYCIDYVVYENVIRIYLSYDGKTVFVLYNKNSSAYKKEIFDSLRMPFLYLAQMNNMIAFHAAAIEYADGAWLLVGKSGTGKSTLAGYMLKNAGSSILNGDVGLVEVQCGKVYFHGVPWCGTSGIGINIQAELRGVVLLSQGSDNKAVELKVDDVVYHLMGRTFSPVFTETDVDKQMNLVYHIYNGCPIFSYYFVNDISAAVELSRYIEKIIVT